MMQTKSNPSSALATSRWNSRAGGSIQLVALGLLILFLFVADGWFIYRSIVEVKGNSFDFYFIWVGTREVGQGRDPYTPEVAREIKLAVSDNSAGTENGYYFVYPAFLTFLVWPFVSFPFPQSVTGWVVSQQICLFIALLLALGSMKSRPPAASVIGLVVVWVTFRYTWVTLVLGQTSLLVLFFLSAACYASLRHRERTTGILLAMAMIKPQLVLLTILGWLVIRVRERQWRVIGTYGAGVLALALLPMMVIGNWIPSFLRALFLHQIYGRPSAAPLSILASLAPGFSAVIELVGAALCVAYLLWVASKTRNMTAVASLGVLSTLFLIPLASVYDISLALLPWLACWRVLSARRDVTSRILVAVLWSLPIVSWLVITILPAMLDVLALPFNALICDKLVIPVTLFFIFVYAERKQMWLTAC